MGSEENIYGHKVDIDGQMFSPLCKNGSSNWNQIDKLLIPESEISRRSNVEIMYQVCQIKKSIFK
jgi:hypothetical protein